MCGSAFDCNESYQYTAANRHRKSHYLSSRLVPESHCFAVEQVHACPAHWVCVRFRVPVVGHPFGPNILLCGSSGR